MNGILTLDVETYHRGRLVALDVLLKVLLQGDAVVLDVLLQVLGLLQQVLPADAARVVDFLRHRPPVLQKQNKSLLYHMFIDQSLPN